VTDEGPAAHGLHALHHLHGHVPPLPALQDEEPSNMNGFKDCTLMAKYADYVTQQQSPCAFAAVNMEFEAAISAVSGGRDQDLSPRDQRREHRSLSRKGRSHRKTLGPHQDDSEICFYHTTTATRPGNASLAVCGWEIARLPGTEHSRRRHDFSAR
jgi:hypothetical protein